VQDVSEGRLPPLKILISFNFTVRDLHRADNSGRAGLGYELSSLARTLGSWVRKPLEAWMSVCVYSVFVLGNGLAMGCRSHWPRGLRHELSSLARTLGSWVRIPLEAWMSVCVR
jgi:hypothetical protein